MVAILVAILLVNNAMFLYGLTGRRHFRGYHDLEPSHYWQKFYLSSPKRALLIVLATIAARFQLFNEDIATSKLSKKNLNPTTIFYDM